MVKGGACQSSWKLTKDTLAGILLIQNQLDRRKNGVRLVRNAAVLVRGGLVMFAMWNWLVERDGFLRRGPRRSRGTTGMRVRQRLQ